MIFYINAILDVTMPLFSFKALKQAYRQVQFDDKLNALTNEAATDVDTEIFLFAKDEKINELLAILMKDVDKLISKYKMNGKRDEIVSKVSSEFKMHVNNYILNNIQYLPTRDRSQPLPF